MSWWWCDYVIIDDLKNMIMLWWWCDYVMMIWRTWLCCDYVMMRACIKSGENILVQHLDFETRYLLTQQYIDQVGNNGLLLQSVCLYQSFTQSKSHQMDKVWKCDFPAGLLIPVIFLNPPYLCPPGLLSPPNHHQLKSYLLGLVALMPVKVKSFSWIFALISQCQCSVEGFCHQN